MKKNNFTLSGICSAVEPLKKLPLFTEVLLVNSKYGKQLKGPFEGAGSINQKGSHPQDGILHSSDKRRRMLSLHQHGTIPRIHR